MTELPLEIIQHLVEVSAPLPSFDNRDRSDFLLPLCHLNSSLLRIAQKALFTHPVVVVESKADLILERRTQKLPEVVDARIGIDGAWTDSRDPPRDSADSYSGTLSCGKSVVGLPSPSFCFADQTLPK